MVDAIKEFVEYVRGLKLGREVTKTVNGDIYAVEANNTLGKLVRKAAPVYKPVLEVKTLTGFVDAFNAKIDEFPEEVAVQVVDHLTVSLVSLRADEFGHRHVYVSATCTEKNPFVFGNYYTPEEFIINLEAGFFPMDSTADGGPEAISAHVNLQRLASCVTSESSISTQDDGISQTIELKSGATTKAAVDLPRRIPLYPYRTFREVDPVKTEFLVRLKGVKDDLPRITLLEIDGGRWKGDTVLQVSRWLKGALPEGTTIIA